VGVYKLSAPGTFKNSRTLYKSFLTGNPAVILDNGSYFPLGEFTLASAQATINFTNIPQTYKHLQIRAIARTTSTNSESWQSMRFNGNTTGYNNHQLVGNGSSASSVYENLANRINFGTTAGNPATANTYGSIIVDILDYTNTNKNKVVRFLEGYDTNGSGTVILRSGLWQNTSAITSILMGPENFANGNYAANSQFALYGVLA
jgi:hypothetical protein